MCYSGLQVEGVALRLLSHLVVEGVVARLLTDPGVNLLVLHRIGGVRIQMLGSLIRLLVERQVLVSQFLLF